VLLLLLVAKLKKSTEKHQREVEKKPEKKRKQDAHLNI